MKTSLLATRRPIILALSWAAVLVWYALTCVSSEIAHMGRMTFPIWISVVVVYTLDRSLRLRFCYEGMLGTVAYWILHDIPMNLRIGALQPSTGSQFQLLLVLTGAVAALPFGRRGPGVAALAGTLLGCLWIGYRMERMGLAFDSVRVFETTVFTGFVFMTLGGLISERLTRRWRGDAGAPGAHGALWGFALGAASALMLARW
jgi:hypothetical protein